MNNRALTAVSFFLAAAMVFAGPVSAEDKDNNPPGPKGGKGTNWENPPGPEGGPGARPDRSQRHWKEKADTDGDGVLSDAERDAAKEIRKEEHEERREEFKEKADLNHDGTIDEFERQEAKKHHDRDNNPPGPKGGAGTNWENPPGPEGGPGVGPDHKRQDWKEKADLNDDGKVGRVERREARQHKDRDNNPPGPQGGKGTNWENPPGAKGGPGASPNRHKQ